MAYAKKIILTFIINYVTYIILLSFRDLLKIYNMNNFITISKNDNLTSPFIISYFMVLMYESLYHSNNYRRLDKMSRVKLLAVSVYYKTVVYSLIDSEATRI